MAGNFFQTKQAARQAVEAVRRSLSSQQVSEWGGEVQRHLAASSFFSGARTVALYDAQGFEVPTGQLRAAAPRVCLPRVIKGNRVLAFHLVEAADQLVAGPLGLRQPGEHLHEVALTEIDLWVVPGVAFTRDGRRLGRGGGYYDATLALARPDSVKVGVTFECCVVDGFPTEAHDLGVDWLATERGMQKKQ